MTRQPIANNLRVEFIETPVFEIVNQSDDTAYVLVGNQVTFFVEVRGGVEPYTYEWLEDGQPYATGQNSITFTPPLGDDGKTYQCRINDATGSLLISNEFLLRVGLNPTLVEGPIGIAVNGVLAEEQGTDVYPGDVLTIITGDYGDEATFDFEWNTGSESSSYIVQESDVGNVVFGGMKVTNQFSTSVIIPINYFMAVERPFDPTQIVGLEQWTLDQGKGYAGQDLNGNWQLEDLVHPNLQPALQDRSITQTSTQLASCNDQAKLEAENITYPWAMGSRFSAPDDSNIILASIAGTSASVRYFRLRARSAGLFDIFRRNSLGQLVDATASLTHPRWDDGELHSVIVEFLSETHLRVWMDGVVILDRPDAESFTPGVDQWQYIYPCGVGANAAAGPVNFYGSFFINRGLTQEDVDGWNDGIMPEGIFAGYYFNEQVGGTHYDCSGNDYHCTIYNADTTEGGPYHTVSTNGTGNESRRLGFSVQSGAIVPADLSNPTRDVLGGSLQYAGGDGIPMHVAVAAFTSSGVDEAITLPIDTTEVTELEFNVRLGATPIHLGNIIALHNGTSSFPLLSVNWANGGRLGVQARSLGNTSIGAYMSAGTIEPERWYHVKAKVKWLNPGYIALWVDGEQVVDYTSAVDCSTGTPLSVLCIGHTNQPTGQPSGFQACSVSDIKLIGDFGFDSIQVPLQEGTGRDVLIIENGVPTTQVGAITGGNEAAIWSERTTLAPDYELVETGQLSPYSRVDTDPYNLLPNLNMVHAWPGMSCWTGLRGADHKLSLGTISNATVIEFLLKCSGGYTDGDIFGIRAGTPICSLGRSSAGRLGVTVRTTTGYQFFTSQLNAILDDVWYKIRMEVDYQVNGAVRLYINDVLNSQVGPIDHSAGVTGPFFIGASAATGTFFTGQIRDFRIVHDGGEFFYPLTDGQGVDIAEWNGDMMNIRQGILASANAWGQVSEGEFSPDDRSMPSIITRATKWAGDREKFITTSTPVPANQTQKLLDYLRGS